MKRVFLFAFLAFAYSATQAQLGVKAGLNIANWGGDDADFDGKKTLLGIHGGVFYVIAVNDKISVVPDLVFSTQGVKVEEFGEEAKLVLSYINLTPMVRYNSSGFWVGVGPQIGFLLSAKAKDGDDEDIKDEFKGIDIAAAIGLGYEMESGFGIYARYNHGISNIIDEDDVKVTNRVFQVGISYKFKTNK